MAVALQEALGERYQAAVAAGDIVSQVPLRDGSIVPQVEHRVREQGIFMRTLPQRYSWLVEVGTYSGEQVELPLKEDLTVSAEPVNVMVDRRDGHAEICFKRDLARVSDFGMQFLKDMLDRAETVHPAQKTLNTISPAELTAIHPETGEQQTLAGLALELMTKSQQAHHADRSNGYAEYDTGPDDAWCLRSWAMHPPTLGRLMLQGPVDAKTQKLTGGDIMCTIAFSELQGWQTVDGLIADHELGMLLEGTEAVVLNEGTDAGFSHLTGDSLARMYEIMRTALPCRQPGS